MIPLREKYFGNFQIFIFRGKDGAKVPLTSVAKIDFSGGIGAINRKDLKRVVTVSANAEGRLGNDVLIDVKEKLKDLKFPTGYGIVYTGEQEKSGKSHRHFLPKLFDFAASCFSFL
ncbi:MAG: efflux RND transporter permease subunit [Ignavibacteria bacterium]|nr:efflux RND transporter permease subunit [Ignavibacteria bacterium]